MTEYKRVKKLIKKILKESEWDWVNEIKPSDLNPFYQNGVTLLIDMKPTLEQSRTIWDWLVQADKTTEEQNKKHNRVKNLTKGYMMPYMLILYSGHFLWNVDSVNYKEYRDKKLISGDVIKLSDILPDEVRLKHDNLSPTRKKKTRKKELKEGQLDLFSGAGETKYERCSHFKGNEPHRKLCYELYTLGSFLYKDLGLKDIINQKIKLMGEVKDLNDKYQNPLMLLYKTGKFNDIKREIKFECKQVG